MAGIDRRMLLKGGAALAATLATSSAGAAGTAEPRLLFVIMRGGVDGLSLLPPLGDPAYCLARRHR